MQVIDTEDLKKLPENVFVPLLGVKTNTDTAGSEIIANVIKHAREPWPRLHKLPGFMKSKGPDKKIAIVGGGPSLKNYLDEIRNFDGEVLVAGSPNDYLMGEGIIPTYTAVCDPDAIMAKYLTRTDERVKYLVASGCNDAVFQALKHRQLVMWHCHSDQYAKEMQEADPEYFGVGGGCTIGLRCLSIAVVMGYSNIHFFGYDSCMDPDDPKEGHHAYKFVTAEEEIGEIHEIRVGSLFDGAAGASRVYHCAGYQLAQAEQFKMFYSQYGRTFTPTFHGEGLLKATARVVEEETHRVALMHAMMGPPNMQNFNLAA